jgi:response regulator RpfG family c-di-GMP phosphodiesterase
MTREVSGRRVIIVEDDESLRKMLTRHLRKRGFTVIEAGDAESVLLRASRERRPFDVAVADVHLPGLSGVELLRLLLAHSPLKPVLLITGDGEEALARKALQAGAAGYLLKPFELFELDAALDQALSRVELLETTEALARSGRVTQTDDISTGVPVDWLELADHRSEAGAGHGYRVARLAGTLAANLPLPPDTREQEALESAARAHELGRLLGPVADPNTLAARTAEFLHNLDTPPSVMRIVNNFRERWDGSGQPVGLSGHEIPPASLVLAAADMLDQHAAQRLAGGDEPGAAMSTAFDEVRERAPDAFGPDVTAALDAAQDVVTAIWVLARGRAGEIPEEI